MQYIEGDLFKGVLESEGKTTIVIPHVCNDKGKMGAGFVLPLQKTFPNSKISYELWSSGKTDDEIRDSVCQVSSTGVFRLGQTQFVQVQDKSESKPRVIVANMVAQTLDGKRPLYYNHLVRCMTQVASLIRKTNIQIICPMFAGGLAGGDWRFIHSLIEDCWERDMKGLCEVTVYYLDQFVKDTDREVMSK